MATANEKLIKNLENQLERLVEQLKDLEDCKNEIPKDEYDIMKEETVEQIKEFGETLDRLQKGDITLNNKFSTMKTAIRNAIASSFNTIEMIKMFGAQNANEMENQLLQLDQEFRMKKINENDFKQKKIELLTQLQNEGRAISTEDSAFLQKVRDNILDRLEQVEDD